MTRRTRREFLRNSAAASAAFATFTVAGTKASGKVLGANDTIRIGVAGLNGRGGSHVGAFAGMKGVQVTYLIDPDTHTHNRRASHVKDRGGNTPQGVQDFRKALEDKNLDAISIATPNHWHAPLAIMAVQADKHVYVEKPCSHNVREGRILADLARKHKRIVQHGTQSRSSGGWAKKAAEIAAGKHGKLLVSRGTCFKRRKSIGFKKTEQPPSHVDFNIWLGPAPEQPFHRNLVHYNWHWFWDFGNGDIGNQGVHQMDIARWMIPGATLPKSVVSLGGRFGYTDQGQTPNTQIAVFDYGDALLVFEVRGLPTKGGVGNTQHFDKNASPGKQQVTQHEGVKSPVGSRGPGSIFSNFIHAVRSGKTEDLDAHILEGHYSSALCHLANVSHRLGEPTEFDTRRGVFKDNEFASDKLNEMREHLKDNGVRLDDTEYQLGRVLKVDAEKEQIIGDDEANALLTREYRAPFTIPKTVS